MKRDLGTDTLISVVAPIYNELDVIETFVGEVRDALAALDVAARSQLVLVNDGSSDGSGEKLDEMAGRHPGQIKVVHLSRNFGHMSAVSAGLEHADGDLVILMDSDLQDDPVAFSDFIEKWREGYDVVYAKRESRQESRLMAFAFRSFYRILAWIADTKLPPDAGNFALTDRRVVDKVISLKETNRYLPGLRAWVGFRQTGVPVHRRARYDASTRVGLRGLWTLAMNAVFSFSYVPIFVFRAIGVLAMALSVVLIVLAICLKLFGGAHLTTWLWQLALISFFGGVNLFGVSVIGEYVARIYDEVKGRPMYIVDRIITGQEDS